MLFVRASATRLVVTGTPSARGCCVSAVSTRTVSDLRFSWRPARKRSASRSGSRLFAWRRTPHSALADEGLAEYYEVPRERPGIQHRHLQLLGHAYRHADWRPDLARLETLAAANELTQLDYAEAWLWTYFLLNHDAQTRSFLQQFLAECQHAPTQPTAVRATNGLPSRSSATTDQATEKFVRAVLMRPTICFLRDRGVGKIDRFSQRAVSVAGGQ